MKHVWMACGIACLLVLTGCQSTGELGGTNWSVAEVLTTSRPDVADMNVEFGTDGWLTTTWMDTDGNIETARRRYDVHKSLIVVTRPEVGDLHLLHRVDGDEMYVTCEAFQVRMERLD